MKFGIIGSGMIARFHAKAISDMTGGELHAVYGKRSEAVMPIADEFGAKAYTDLGEFLNDPELEIVTIATPSAVHQLYKGGGGVGVTLLEEMSEEGITIATLTLATQGDYYVIHKVQSYISL